MTNIEEILDMITQILGILMIYVLYVVGYYTFKEFDVRTEFCVVWPLMLAVMLIITIVYIIPTELIKKILGIRE